MPTLKQWDGEKWVPASAGYVGSKGDIGFTGSQGTIGVTGYTGSKGYSGSIGTTGFTGSIGGIGYTGSLGNVGSTGYTGSLGFTGSQSTVIGYTGSKGYSGSQGPIGYSGSLGSLGYTGSAGAGVNALTDLTDVTISTAEGYQVLRKGATDWVNGGPIYIGSAAPTSPFTDMLWVDLDDNAGGVVEIIGDTMEGELVAQNNVNYTTAQMRNIILSTSDPSGGGNGDIWIKYTP